MAEENVPLLVWAKTRRAALEMVIVPCKLVVVPTNAPAPTIVPPPYVLAPANVNVPAPILVSDPPAPLIIPA